MKKKKKNKKETLNFRVSAEFKQRLIEEAEKERRSLTNYLENTLTRLWEERQLGAIRGREPKRS
jgi:predicted HicB family RNase H-like nuclease